MDSPTDTLVETLSVFEDASSGRPLTTDEVADRLDLDRRTAAEHLERLVERGALGTREISTDGRVWWQPPDESDGTLTVNPESEGGDDPSGTERQRVGANTIPAGEILDTAEIGVLVLDAAFDALGDDWRFTYVNDRAEELLGRSDSDLLGRNIWEALSIPADDPIRETFETVMATQEPRSAEQFWDSQGVWTNVSIYPSESGVSVYLTDVTERKAHERELERQIRQQEVVAELGERALEEPTLDALFADATEQVAETLDSDYCTVLDLDADAQEFLVRQGVGWDEGIVESATVSALEDGSQAGFTLAAGQPVVIDDLTAETRFSDPEMVTSHDVRSGVCTTIGSRDDPWGVLAVHDTCHREFSGQDVTFVRSVANILATAIYRNRDRQELARQREQLRDRERALRRTYEITADADRTVPEQIEALLAVVREAVGTDYATLSHVVDDEYVFEHLDAPADADLEAGDSVPLGTTNCERVVATEQTLVLNNVAADAPELADRAGNADWGISCYLGAPVVVDGEPYGTFCFYDLEARTEDFSEWEVAFVELLSDWVGNRLERHQYVDQLEALNSLNDVVREITDAAIEQSTREEIEEIVCECLAATDSYLFAWIGERDVPSQEMTVRAEAGTEGYLDETEISLDPDDERSKGPTSKAYRTGEIQTIQNVRIDPEYEPWRETAEMYGFQSLAAIPIVHGETIYGVLNVYAERPRAFEGEEQQVLGQLGEIVGHAIAAADRKQALLSDEVVEVEFRIPNVFETLDTDVSTDGRITLSEIVPCGDDDYLVYGTATADAVDGITALVDAVPHWTAISFIGGNEAEEETESEQRFELRLSEPPVLEAVAARGGSIERATIEDGNYRLVIHLPPSVDVREIMDIVEDTYPTVDMVSRQQRSLEDPSLGWTSFLSDELTDHQRTTLKAAYYSGYFNWPRDSTAEEVAESLDVSSPTVHKHLRKVQRKVFDAVLSEPAS